MTKKVKNNKPKTSKKRILDKISSPEDLKKLDIDQLKTLAEEIRNEIIQVTAQKGEDLLRKDIETIAGFNQLGEVALVPHSSPISQSGRVFNIILYDENASCHLALGNAYRLSIEGGEEMSDEEFAQAGGNLSQDHWDFMIGSEEMDVDGIKEDGSTEPVMRGGEWAFDV